MNDNTVVIELPKSLNVYVKAINETYAMDLEKVPAERIQRALVFGWQTMFGNARNGAGQGNGSNVAMITPHIQKKVDQQYTAIEAGTTGQRSVDPVEREAKRLARDLAVQWLTKNSKNKKDHSAEYDARVAKYAVNEKVIAQAKTNIESKAALAGLED